MPPRATAHGGIAGTHARPILATWERALPFTTCAPVFGRARDLPPCLSVPRPKARLHAPGRAPAQVAPRRPGAAWPLHPEGRRRRRSCGWSPRRPSQHPKHAGDEAEEFLGRRRPVEAAVRPDDSAVNGDVHRIGHSAHQESSSAAGRQCDRRSHPPGGSRLAPSLERITSREHESHTSPRCAPRIPALNTSGVRPRPGWRPPRRSGCRWPSGSVVAPTRQTDGTALITCRRIALDPPVASGHESSPSRA